MTREVSPNVELVILQTITGVVVLKGLRTGIESGQAPIGAQPEGPGRVDLDTVDHIVRQAVFLCVVAERLSCTVEAIQPTAPRADPHHPGWVFVERKGLIIAQALRFIWIVHVVREPAVGGVQHVDAPQSAYPKCTSPVLVECPNTVVAETEGIIRIVLVPCKAPHSGIEPIQAPGSRANPQVAQAILEERGDPVLADAVWVVGVMPVVRKRLGQPVIPIESPSGPHPQGALAILQDCSHVIATQAGRIVRVVSVLGEAT